MGQNGQIKYIGSFSRHLLLIQSNSLPFLTNSAEGCDLDIFTLERLMREAASDESIHFPESSRLFALTHDLYCMT